jgi:dTMP kinase
MFISFEGTEGVGKTTLINRVEQWLQAQQQPYLRTREPGGTPLAEHIRALLLTPQTEPMAADCELLLLFAARAQHMQQKIMPALDAGQWVLCDRFIDASFAYQAGGRGITSAKIQQLVDMFVPVLPQYTFWLDAPVEIGLQRAQQRGQLDRFEQEKVEFFQKVRACYQQRAAAEPARFVRLDATQSADQVWQMAEQFLLAHAAKPDKSINLA